MKRCFIKISFIILSNIITVAESLDSSYSNQIKQIVRDSWDINDHTGAFNMALEAHIQSLPTNQLVDFRHALLDEYAHQTNANIRHYLLHLALGDYLFPSPACEDPLIRPRCFDLLISVNINERRKALLTLIKTSYCPESDKIKIRNMFNSGRWDMLVLAIRYGMKDFENEIRDALNSRDTYFWQKKGHISVYPSFYSEDILQKLPKWDRIRYQFGEQPVDYYDLAKAYLALCGDITLLNELKTSFAKAGVATNVRNYENKDKLYWYSLLCMIRCPPDDFPFISLKGHGPE